WRRGRVPGRARLPCTTLLAREALRLRRGMGTRRAVSDRRLRRLFARLRAGLARPVPARLTESEHLCSPIALGAAEVCLPTRAQDLDDAALAAVRGHGVRSLLERDGRRRPRWLGPLLVMGLGSVALALPSLGNQGQAQAALPDATADTAPSTPPAPPLIAPAPVKPARPAPPRHVAVAP